MEAQLHTSPPGLPAGTLPSPPPLNHLLPVPPAMGLRDGEPRVGLASGVGLRGCGQKGMVGFPAAWSLVVAVCVSGAGVPGVGGPSIMQRTSHLPEASAGSTGPASATGICI